MIFLYEVFQDLQIKGTKSNHGIIIIITWTVWDTLEVVPSYWQKKIKNGDQKIRRLNVPLNRREE